METRAYGLFIRTQRTYNDALEAVKASLKAEGFGVLTEIDVKATMKEKLGVDFRRYDIIGACNPPLAHRALQGDLDVGLLLPCNVIVYEDEDGCVVAAVDPEEMMRSAGSPALAPVAAEAKAKLRNALASLEDDVRD